jgi:peptidoglycan hydrolase-like protein with peptidoglycan-binding domain
MAEEDTTGAIVLGLLVAGVGVLAVDQAFSDPGTSMFDKIKAKLASRENLPETTPRPRRDRGLPAGAQVRTAPAASSTQMGPPLPRVAPRAPQARSATPPVSVTPDVVSQIAARLNLRTNGLITPEMQQAIKGLQAQLGLPQTGFPDARVLQQLGIGVHAAPARTRLSAPATPTKEAANVVSKTFGGPPSTPATGPDEGLRKTQQMLNAYFKGHVIEEDGIAGPHTTGAITEFQKAEGLEPTGRMDSATHDLLAKRTSGGDSPSPGGILSWLHKTGVGDGDWKAETQSLGQFDQDVIAKVISSESNQGIVKRVGKMLGDAGFPKAAAAVLVKAGGTATTGFGYFSDPYFGWSPEAYGAYGAYGPWWPQ